MTSAAATPVPMIDHRTVLAAAGSGKTYQLSTRYLQLLHLGALPESILATTFTRLAAGEIRDRIVQRLIESLEDSASREALAKQLQSPIEPPEIVTLIRSLVRNVDAQQIRTLDSFFASIVRTFSMELGLPPGSRVIDAEQLIPLRREAIRQLLDERDPQKFVNLFRRFTQGDVSRSVTRAIDRVAGGLYELYRDTVPDAWECIPRQTELSREELIDVQQAVRELPMPSHKGFVKGHAKARQALDAHDWEGLLKAGLVEKIRGGETNYYKKPISSEMREAYLRAADHASAVLINLAADQTIATRELLDRYHERLVELKRAHGVMTFSDLTFALLDDSQNGSLEELWFRLDGRIDHLLLDEFQDTAATQWRVLRRLAEEITATLPPDRSLFCVGDMKQSIYGWRHAEPRLLKQLPGLLGGSVSAETISTTRRSAQPIVDAVNIVYSSLMKTRIGSKYEHACEIWLEGFEHHNTINEQAGYVELVELEFTPENEEKQITRLVRAAECIASLHDRNPALHIGVLTRDNATVTRLLARLGTEAPHVNASGYGGTSLTDAAPVNAILDLLQLADHPHDTTASFHVACSPVRAIVEPMLADGEDLDIARLFDRKKGGKERSIVASTIRKQLLERGYGAVISEWVGRLLGDCDMRQARRLTQLADLARVWSPTGWHPVADFIAFVESRRVADVVPASVEIMTIHQAKGLEFDIVVLPELDEDLRGRNEIIAYDRHDIEGPITSICRYMNEQTRAILPELDPLFDSNTSRQVRDSLSLLYVAMTRAKRGVHMFIDGIPPTKKDINLTMAGLLRATLVKPDGRSGVLYRAGEDTWIDSTAKPEDKQQVRRDATSPIDDQETLTDLHDDDDARPAVERRTVALQPTPHLHVRGEAAPPASQMAREGKPLRTRMQLGSEGAFEHGTAIHALFQHITWLDDFTQDDEALEQIIRRELPRHGTAWVKQRVRRFRELISQPTVRGVLSRPSDHASIAVHCEIPIARLVGQRTQWSIIDRLVVRHATDSDRPTALCIIDYKTDDVAPQHAARRADEYRQQMHTYREAAAELFRVDASIVTMQLLFVSADAIVDVE